MSSEANHSRQEIDAVVGDTCSIGCTSNLDHDRRCSLPSDRPNVIRRHLQLLKAKRKISSPFSFALPVGGSRQMETAKFPLSDIFKYFRPSNRIDLENSGHGRTSICDSGVAESSVTESPSPSPFLDLHTSRDNSCPARIHYGSMDDEFNSEIEDFLKQPLYIDTRLANTSAVGHQGTSSEPRQCVYSRKFPTNTAETASRVSRPRCKSDSGRYFLIRKRSDNRRELMGRLEENEFAYFQILAALKCYDLMPPSAKMVLFDSSLPIRQAFLAFVNNNIRAAPIWDSRKQLFRGLLTVTDFIHLLLLNHATESDDFNGSNSPGLLDSKSTLDECLNLPLHTLTTPSSGIRRCFTSSGVHSGQYYLNHVTYAMADETAAKAAKLLCDRRLHRLLILDQEKGGNPLFLLSKKDILKGLWKYILKLPLPACMEKTLEELMIGTWSNLTTVNPDTTIRSALLLFVQKGLSALPIIDANCHLLDVLTKVDVMNLAVECRGPTHDVLSNTVTDAVDKRREGLERVTVCSKKTTLLLVVESIVHSEAHRLTIVDSDGRLEGLLSLTDLMRFLNDQGW